jgi:hypothetical protein
MSNETNEGQSTYIELSSALREKLLIISNSDAFAAGATLASVKGFLVLSSACSPRAVRPLRVVLIRPPLPSSILPYVAYDRTPNLNAVVNARFSWVGRVAGGGNLRERSAVACLLGPGFDFGLRGDRGRRESGSMSSSGALPVGS